MKDNLKQIEDTLFSIGKWTPEQRRLFREGWVYGVKVQPEYTEFNLSPPAEPHKGFTMAIAHKGKAGDAG